MNKKLSFRLILCAVALSFPLLLFAGCVSRTTCGDCDCADRQKIYAEEPGKEQQRDAIITVLDNINGFRPGTLGSSLKVQIMSFAFIDFSQEDVASDIASFTDVASGYIAALDEEQLGFFKENVARIEEVASELFTQGLDSLLPILDDAGNPQKHETYDEEKYASLMTAFKSLLAVS